MTNAEMLKLILKDEAAGVPSSFVPQIITQEGAPMIAQDMPDYGKFCADYLANCELCREYIPDDRSGLFCLRWEKTFPGKVKWYEKGEIQTKNMRRKNEKINEIFKAKNTQF